MARTLLLVGAGVMQVPAIRLARELGLTTVVTDYNVDAVGMRLADHPLVMSTRDIEGTVRVAKQFARRHRIDGVITVGTDASMTVAAVAQALGLPGITYEAAERATNKLKMRRRLREAGVPCPEFRAAWTLADARAAFRDLGFPAVIKPADNMGARGVQKVSGTDEVDAAFRHAKSCSTSGEVIVEQFMAGPELSIDALVWEGEPVLWGVADRIIDLPPYFIELGHTLPSVLPAAQQAEACRVMADAIRALGITTGAAKGDIKVTPGGIMVGEVAARLSGGFMSGYTYPLATGISIIHGAISIALGDDPRPFPAPATRTALERAIIPAPGHIVSISGVEEARQVPGVREIFLTCHEGMTLPPPTCNLDKAGHIITVGSTRAEAETAAAQAARQVKITVGPAPVDSLKEIYARARLLLNSSCRACEPCDGVWCRGLIPGMGGAGDNRAFRANLQALAAWQLRSRVIHGVKEPATGTELFGCRLELPVIAAPVTGVQTNMGGGMTEEAYVRAVLRGCRAAGTLACVGDRATPDKYRLNLQALQDEGGSGIAIFKPLCDRAALLRRLREAEQAGATAVGLDLDSAPLATMQHAATRVEPKSADQLAEYIRATRLPFILKGILSVADAQRAVELGARGIMVSNHGGRVLDGLPGAAAVLPEIAGAVRGRITIILDGGVRSGEDVFRGLALGADLVTIGRPLAICAIGADDIGVEFLLRHLRRGLLHAMQLTGCATLAAITRDTLRPA